jgi:hypothetical protein
MEKTLETLEESEKRLCELLERAIEPATVQQALEAVRNAISVLKTGQNQAAIRAVGK